MTPSPAPRPMGRPREKNQNGQRYYAGRLHGVLVEKLPRFVGPDGRLEVRPLSEATGNARYTVYRWLTEDKLSARAARSLIAVSTDPDTEESTLSLDDLSSFVFRL